MLSFRDGLIVVSLAGLATFGPAAFAQQQVAVTAPQQAITVGTNENVGIGTQTPEELLHVQGAGNVVHLLESSDDGSVQIRLSSMDTNRRILARNGQAGSVGNESQIILGDDGDFEFIGQTAADKRMKITSVGDVGIGTDAPLADLHIKDTGTNSPTDNAGIYLEANGKTWEILNNATTSQFVVREKDGDAPFKIDGTGSSNLLTVGMDTAGAASANTVSVGRDTFEAVLDVQGSIIVDGVTEHADYVFKKDYELRSIEEHAQFMWEQEHLPSLPKAPEGLRGPVDLVGHQMGVLEELEVAHIYIERLHERLKEKEARVVELERRMQERDAVMAARLARLEALVSGTAADD